MDDLTKSYYIEALMYSICYDIDNKTQIVDKWLKQIKKGLRNTTASFYRRLTHDVHNAWEITRREIIDTKVDVNISELLLVLYNAIPCKNKYYTDNTFTKVINSFESCYKYLKKESKPEHTTYARRLANRFLDEIEVERKSKLSTRKKIIQGNILTDGRA